MGFLSSVLGGAGAVAGGLLGGGGSSTTAPATGFYALPKELQTLYKNVLGQAGSAVLPNGQLPTEAYTPMALTGGEQNAISNINQGFTPTTDSLNSDISMLMGNPYNDSVINEINRQAQGQNSLVNQAATQAGQQNSNRSFLGSSDVEQNRLNNIGQFQQQQYNTALGQVLNNLTPQRQSDAMNALTAGTYQRNLDTQTKQAPINALSGILGPLNGIASSMQGTPATTVKSGGGLSGTLGDIGQGVQLATTLASFFSDERLKQDIVQIGRENGHNIYEFKYKNHPQHKFVGVMAQEVQQKNPEAVIEENGYLKVNYDMIGVKMRYLGNG